MVAVVAGNGLGLFNTSLNILGAAAGSFGQGNLGQAGGKAWVNASTGNLILRFTDEQLSGQGQDLFHTRTYNTLGALNDADGDGWRWDGERRVILSGTALTAGSSLTRITGDGHETVYTWNGSRYQSSDGDGAHDFIQLDGQTGEWYWTDGTTRSVERYNGSSGLLTSVHDTQGTQIDYGYHNGRLSSVSDSSGQALLMVYNEAGQMVRLDTRSSANGPLTSQVYYVYDNNGRLLQVKTDLTPDDNSIADGQFYLTTYTYDGSSFRIARVDQSDGTSASFTYELVGSEYRVKTVNDSSGATTFTYFSNYTKVRNALNQEWVYTYDEKGQLTFVQSPAENGQSFYTGYGYDADGNVTLVSDNNGNAVSYVYDERGNRILERDPKGVTVARTFSASNQVLSEIHYSQPATWYAASGTWGEPPASSAQVTRYVYDYADRLRFVVSATGSVAEYRYNGNGLRTREIVYGDSRYDLTGLAANTAIAESTLINWAASRDQTRSQVVTLSYDYRGNLNQRVVYAKVSAAGEPELDTSTSLTEYVYSQHGQLLQTVTLHGASRPVLSSTSYDGMGRVLAQMDASGTRTTVYDGQHNRIAVTTASGLLLTQVYDPVGRLVRIEEAVAGGAVRGYTYYVYDAAGRQIMKEDATGVRTYTFYDALGRVAAEVDGTGSITRYSYNQKDQRISALSYATQVDTRAWFNAGVVTVTLAQILPASTAADRLTRLDYDNAGRLLNSVDAAGIVTAYEYDGRGQLVQQKVGARVTRLFYDADGRQVGQLDAEGYLRENVYNAAGQLQQVIRYAVATTAASSASLTELRPAGASLSTWNFYDGAGRQIGSVDEQGFVSETVYDESTNTTTSIRYATVYTAALTTTSSFATIRDAVKNGARQVQVTAYDGQGRVLSRTATDGSVTTYEYDAAGRLVRETAAAGTAEERSVRTLYDAFGQTTGKLLGEASARITAGMSQAQIAAVYSQYGTTWNYDAAGRVASVTDALGNRTLSYYDAAGRLTRVINAVGEVSETKYNAFGDAVERTQLAGRLAPGSFANQNVATLDGLVAAIRNANNDSRSTYAYDTRGLLLTSIDAEGISTTNQYDGYGQLQRQIRVIAGSRTVTSAFGYNLRGERISQTRDAGGLNLTDTTVYDAFGRAIRSTDAAGNLSTSEYLDNGRSVVVRDALNGSRRTELDAFGRTLKEVDALGNVTTYRYDDVNRSVVVTLPDGTQVSTWKTRHGDTLKLVNAKGDTTQYEYNRDGQLTRTIDALGQVAETRRYDKAGRLSESVDARGIVTHLDYDAVNRVMQRSVDPTGLNQRTTYEFDTSGRQIRVVDAAGTSSARVTENRYDRKGQLLQTIVDPNGLQLSTRYSYDGLGNVLRISQGTVASPEQRVTDYVFNAVGQRRFSIDSLGYVTERSYDAAGNVTQETRYANKYAGSRDAATLQTLGRNLLNNVAFANPGSNGAPAGWVIANLAPGITATVNPTNTPSVTAQDLPAGDGIVQIYQTGRDGNGSFQELQQAIPQVSAGQRYSFSAYVAAINAKVELYIAWKDASGKWFGNTDATPASQNETDVGGPSLANYRRLEVSGVAPEGAVSAYVAVRKFDTKEGHTASLLQVAHAQLEVLGASDTGSSAWARPLVTSSAADRVTNYVYDALGRQRFSVDALGYVTERTYDAVGNVLQEVRYANPLAGNRDAVSVQQLGKNRLRNVEFGNASNGVPAGWDAGTSQMTAVAFQTDPDLPGMIPTDLPAGDKVVELYQAGRTGSPLSYMELGQSVSQVVSGIKAGQRYSFSVYTAVQGATASVYIHWIDAAGKRLTYTGQDNASQNAGEGGGGTSLANYKRIFAEGVAPEGAVSALVMIRKGDTVEGASMSRMLAVHAQFEELPEGAVASAWTRPQITSSSADRVTHYVYDALGRQRFSVDALGYVTERTYDVVGNVLQEVRYANPLAGNRTAATVQQLGNNRLRNVEFGNASNGVPAGWSASASEMTGVAFQTGPDLQGMIPTDLPVGDKVVELYQAGRTGNPLSYMELGQSVSQVVSEIKAGQRYSFSVYTAVQGATASVYIYWIDAEGKRLTYTGQDNASQNAGEAGGGTSLDNYKRIFAQGVAPEGAVSALVMIRKGDTVEGASMSRMLAVHAQFEELAEGAEPSVWTRPLITSSADRVTHYVYDALGRQRFSVDALGYVTERSYDAVGNVLQEVRYANPLAGNRTAATVQQLGRNLLNNVTFANPGSNGAPAGWVIANLSSSTMATVNPTNAPSVTAQDLPAGDGIVQIYQTGRDGNGSFQELQQFIPQVSAGQRYAFSAYVAAINAKVELYIAWKDASGNWVGNTDATPASQNEADVGGPSLTNYRRLEASGVAPAGAVSAFVAVRKFDTKEGHTASLLQVAHAQLEVLDASDTGSSAWARPLITSSAADRVTNYTYDALGRQRFSIDAGGYVSERRYDALGNVTQETRYASKYTGSRDALTLKRLGELISTSADDRVGNYVYDALGRQRFSIDALGYVSERSYDGLGNVVQETRYANALSGSRDPATLQQLETGNLKQSISSAADRTTLSRYDATGQLSGITDALGYTEAYTYDAFGNRTSLTNKNGQTWNYRYDQIGQLLEEITPPVWVSTVSAAGAPAGRGAVLVTRNEYNGFGNIISRSEGRQRNSPVSDPALDDLSQVRSATYGYDALGRQIRITSPGWYNKAAGQFQQNSDGTANTFQVTTEVTYDGLGNAVRNRVRMNNTGVASFDYVDSYKAYDLLGQVRYEVDALKGVTVHEYDGFGQETLTRRHASALNAAVPASGYYTAADFTAATLPFSAGNDRALITRYDLLGRKTEVQQDIVGLYSFTGNVATSALKNVAPVKVYGYNSFGEVTRETLVARDINGASVMAQISTVNYYDRAGQRIGSVDAMGYYTRLEYTASGKVSRQDEFANALSAWNESSIPTVERNSRDRSVRFSYDKADRLEATTQENVTYWQQTFAVPNAARATMTQVTGDVVVSRSSYDGVGNVLTLADAAGNITTTKYNALGQVEKVTEPVRYSARAGAANPFDSSVSAAPVIDYSINAFGQVVYERRSAGESQAGLSQITLTVYDAAGHEVREFDAMGSAQSFKVDVAGRRLEESRSISTDLSGWRTNNQTIRRTFSYDSLGQQLGATDWYTDAGVQKSTSNTVVYNRFGEVTSELLNGNAKSSYVYNQLGNAIQQTNAQGVTQVDYDLTGKASRSIQLGNLATSADDRITYLRNDLLGRVLEQHLPAFEANVAADTLNNVSLTLTTPILRQTSDRWGNVLSRTDVRGYVTNYGYDHNNQVVTETLPETDILRENGTSYRASLIHEKRYDARGLLVEEADRMSGGGGVLRTRQHVYNEAGQLVRDIDALGFSRYYAVDAHGNRLGTYDQFGVASFDEYDALNRHTAHGMVRNGQRVTQLVNQYDQAGRLYAEIEGVSTVQETLVSTRQSNELSNISGVAGNTRFSLFDERGNIVETRNESGIQKTFVFNEVNRKVAEIDGLGNSLTWTYNEGDYGRLVSHKELGNRNFSYVYNAFGQVVTENGDKVYSYYSNGLLKSITVTRGEQRNFLIGKKNYYEQWQVVMTSTYAYDLSGNKLSDVLESAINWSTSVDQINTGTNGTRQETRYKFDELGRLVDANTLAGMLAYGTGTFTLVQRQNAQHDTYYRNNFHFSLGYSTKINLSYKFDEFGNRRRVTMDSLKPDGSDLNEDNWFKYDLNDRAVVVDGFLENGAVVAGVRNGLSMSKGYTLNYDAAGRRASSERWSSNASGQSVYERSEYAYNDLNQVVSRAVSKIYRQEGANSNAAVQSISQAKLDLLNSYDERGRVVTQTTYKDGVAQSSAYSVYRGDNQKFSEVTYTYMNGAGYLAQANYFGEAGMFDAVGNQTRYRFATFNTSGVATQIGDYNTIYAGFETYKAVELTAAASGMNSGVTSYFYSGRGDLLHLSSNTQDTFRRYALDGDARMIGRQEAGSGDHQTYLYYQNGALANAGDITLGAITDTLVPISETYPAQAPSSYVVNQGDTFESIAQAVWGDRSMWYLIADANGKDLGEALVVGSSLRIPNVVSSNRNDATTFKPYNPNEVMGDVITSPQPPKPKKKKCNAVASVVMVVVVVVAAIFTAGAAVALATPAAAAASAGVASTAIGGGMAAVMAGGVSAAAITASGLGFVGMAGVTIAAGAVGSLASQAVGKAMGVVDDISWKQAAVAGLGSVVGAGLTNLVSGASSTVGAAVANAGKAGASWQSIAIAYGTQGVAGYTGNYIASKAVGLDTSFSWKNMAASAVGSIVGGAVNRGSGFLSSTIRGQVSAYSSAWMRDKWFGGDKPDYGQIAADAFGNALMDYMVQSMKESARNESFFPGGYSSEAPLEPRVSGGGLGGDLKDAPSESRSPGVNRIGLTDEEVYRGRNSPSEWYEAVIDEAKENISVKFFIDFDTGDLPEAEATRLKGLAGEGVLGFWSRSVNINGKDYQVNSSIVESRDGMPLELRVDKKDPYIRSYNSRGEGFVAGLVSLFVGSRVYYREALYAGYANARQIRDNDFKLIAAHEIGHAVLSIAGGVFDSWEHKGTSTMFGGNTPARVPMPDDKSKVDVMRYYTIDASIVKYDRAIASESDVKSLIYISSRR